MKEKILEILNSYSDAADRYTILNYEDAAEEIAQLICDREAKLIYDGFECFLNKSAAHECLQFFPDSLYKTGFSMKQIEKAIEKLK